MWIHSDFSLNQSAETFEKHRIIIAFEKHRIIIAFEKHSNSIKQECKKRLVVEKQLLPKSHPVSCNSEQPFEFFENYHIFIHLVGH